MKNILKSLILTLFSAVVLFSFGCSKENIRPAESPEQVVKRFYSYIKEGGTTTLGEAYRLIDTQQSKLEEDSFKSTVGKYPRDMDVKIIGSRIDDKKAVAVVTIEFRSASSFGGQMVTTSDINLRLDKGSKSWKIDFAGDTYDENPNMYTMGAPKS